MKTEIKTAIICGIIITIGIVSISVFYNEVDMKRNTPYNNEIADKSKLQKVPSILDATGYINIPSNELAETLEGKVVLYDIWTYSCINCIRTLPYITTWDEKYRNEGLVIVGIHTPEFEFEKDKDNVLAAVQKFDINYPVVLDNEKEIWNAFQNKYWPRKYIADHDGYIRYDHIGEGSYKETEKVIQQLLQERSESLNIKTNTFGLTTLDEFEHSTFRTPELYFGYKFANGRNNLGNENGFKPEEVVEYNIPSEIKQHHFYLDGKWNNSKDSMELVSENGLIMLNYNAKQVNIVASNSAELQIFVDGAPVPDNMMGSDLTSQNKILVSEPRLYNIINSDYSESHELIISIKGSEFEIFTFTFG
jgi:thiol-disulfide isomerase/thioredoxin